MISMFDILQTAQPKHYTYKQYKVKELRSKRGTQAYNRFRQAVLRKYNFQCAECKSTEHLHVHHIKQYHDNMFLRLQTTNGIALCSDCHAKRHPWMVRYKEPEKKKYILRKKSESLKIRCAPDVQCRETDRAAQTGQAAA
jgi:5-methylcytosine-specific restriction endonuclease McrA